MKATDVIKRDHEAIRDLFNEFKEATAERREEMVPIIFDALDMHEKMEDDHLYSLMKGLAEDEEVFTELEHEQFKLKAEVIAARALPGDKEKRIDSMMETVLAHAEKEEQELLPQAKKIFSSDKLEEIGNSMEPESVVANSEF